MLTIAKLTEWLKERKFPSFRIPQIINAIYKQGIIDYDHITVLPKSLRTDMKAALPLTNLTPNRSTISSDHSTEKILFDLPSNNKIETVLMRFRDGRNSVCVSCQSGCAMGCSFCATGKLKFAQNLSASEIIDQVLYFHNILQKDKQSITNIIFMGMGEPFANLDNVFEAIHILVDDQYFGFSARRITISTCGLIPGIEKMTNFPLPINLAVSLHAPNQSLRETIMPIAKVYPLDQLLPAIKKYYLHTKRRVSFEYVMLKNINDQAKHATELSKLSKNRLLHVNLIPYNSIDLSNLTGSDRKAIDCFKNILQKNGVNVTVRASMGEDIAAACGQLANKTT